MGELTPEKKIRRLLSSFNLASDGFVSLCNTVSTETIIQVKNTRQLQNDPYQIACCYMYRLIKRDGAPFMIYGEHGFAGVKFTDQFLKSLRTNINVPNDGKYLRGFPFITSLNISKAVLDSFENLGALHMGYDAYEQENVLFNEHKSCLVFVENKFVTFAVYERMGQKMFKAAEIHKLWTVTYYAPVRWFGYYWSWTYSRVSLIARSYSDLHTIHPTMPSIIQPFCSRIPSVQVVEKILIFLGWKGFKIDFFLAKLGEELIAERVVSREVHFYFCGASKHLEWVKNTFRSVHNEVLYNNAKIQLQNGRTEFNIATAPEGWSFILTQIGHSTNEHMSEYQEEYYHMTYPVNEANCSFQINRHPRASKKIWAFAGFVEGKHREIVANW